MACMPSFFKPVYQNDCTPAGRVKLFEPPFTVPVCYAWNPSDIDRWLVETGYGRYRPFFREQGITGRSLPDLDPDTLRRMGIRDRTEAAGIAWNIQALSSISRPMSPKELPGLPYTHYRALCFGTQPRLPQRPLREEMCYTSFMEPDHVTLRRIHSLGGDPCGWFERNRPHSIYLLTTLPLF